ncbi:MAG: M20/M25/M40 family metallo-hydrolase [Pyrinomonadaceae bacterium]
MTRQFTYQRVCFQFIILFAFLTILVTLIISGSVKSSAESNKDLPNQPDSSILPKQATENSDREKVKSLLIGWITVDEDELNHIQNAVQNKGGNFDLKIVEKHGKFSVIEADERQILDLTRNMHEEFHKCAGFMWHETLAAACLSIAETLRAESNQPAAVYTIDNQTNVNAMLGETQESQIRETITRLSTDFPNRRHNQPSGLDSANWIKNKWTQLAAGRSDITVEFFNHSVNTTPQPSIIMTVQGTTLPNEVVVLGGHQDSINLNGATLNAPGADDDASGIASMTEVIRVLVARNFRPQRTVKFMAYAAEEIGLRGSNEIAADFQARAVNVVGVLQLDMTNYKSPNSPVDIVVITDFTNAAQNQFIRDLITAYQPSLTFGNSTCGYSCSDHASWTNKGYPASFPFESAPSNQTIHTTGDTLAQSGNNASHALKFTNLAVSYLGELAKGTQGTLGLTYEADVAARPNGSGTVTSTDVSVIQGFQLGLGLPYQSNEFQRADCAPFDTRGDGRVSSIDVSEAQGYQLGNNIDLDGHPPVAAGPTAPTGNPTRFEFDRLPSLNLFSGKANQIGPDDGGQLPREVRIAATSPNAGQTITVPIEVDAFGDESVYGFTLTYDSTRLINPVVSIGTAGGSVSSNTTQAGRIGVSVTFGSGTIAAGNNQRLVNVQFTIAANASAVTTPITFTDQPTFREVASSLSSLDGVQALPTTFVASGIVTINQSTGKSRK